MDLRNLSATPNQLDIQRRPSLSSLSSTSGYASSGYGGANGAHGANGPAANGGPNGGNGRKLHLNEYNNNSTPQNVWNNNNNSSSLNDVTPWVEQQKQQQSKVGTLEMEKGKKNGHGVDTTSPSSPSGNGGRKSVNVVQRDDDDLKDEDADYDDELIPTAIVIKNIPFAIKKEQLLDVMTKLNLPLPYAFNYHFDNGVFRGLAFANFTSTDETSLVVNQLNGREIGGRKLRVEYKKMLPAQERERIEREKREKRGQLEEQHRGNSNTSLASLISATSTTAATKNLSVNGVNSQPERLFLSFPTPGATTSTIPNPVPSDLNFNDFEVLELYTQLVIFKDEGSKTIMELAFPPNLSLSQRKILSVLCTYLNLLELYDNGLIIIRRKPGQLFQVLNPNATGTTPTPAAGPNVANANGPGNGANDESPHPSNSMLNLNQLNNSLHTPTHGHPELLRSHSQSALPLPRLRQQNSTPVQPQFPQFSGNGNNGGKPLYQSFGFMPANQPNLLPTGPFNPSSSAAAILRNNSNSNRGGYGDIRSTPPLANSYPTPHSVTESPTPTPQHAHSNLFNGDQTNGANNDKPVAPPSTSGSKPPSQPSTPLQSNDINSRFAPFGQHSQLAGSLTSLSNPGNAPASRHSEDYGDIPGKFNSINLNYDPSASGSGIWGPK